FTVIARNATPKSRPQTRPSELLSRLSRTAAPNKGPPTGIPSNQGASGHSRAGLSHFDCQTWVTFKDLRKRQVRQEARSPKLNPPKETGKAVRLNGSSSPDECPETGH
ncbi:MAG: hypothetical protein WA376_10165, partial [Terrimicrobiaceae bacterium]